MLVWISHLSSHTIKSILMSCAQNLVSFSKSSCLRHRSFGDLNLVFLIKAGIKELLMEEKLVNNTEVLILLILDVLFDLLNLISIKVQSHLSKLNIKLPQIAVLKYLRPPQFHSKRAVWHLSSLLSCSVDSANRAG